MVQSKKIKEHLPLIVLGIICFIFFSIFIIKPQLLTQKDNDLGRTYVPMFTFIKDSFATYKSVPLWRGDQMMGESLIANPISSLLYPANIFFLIFPTAFAAILYYLLHFIIAAFSSYLLARSFNFQKSQSFATALFYTFSTTILMHFIAGHMTMVAAFAYFPLLFLSVRKLLKQVSAEWLVIGAATGAFMLILYATIFYYASIFCALYIVYFYLFNKIGSDPERISKISLWFLALLYLTAAIAAIELIPQILFSPISTRSQLSYQDVAIPLFNLKRYAQSLIFPYLNFKDIDQESFLYLGMIPTVFAIFGFLKLSVKKKLVLIFIGLITLLYVAGQSTPVFAIAYKLLPLLKYSRVTTRLWFVVALIVALLAGYGLKSIKSLKILTTILAVFLIETLTIFYQKTLQTPNLNFNNQQLYETISKDNGTFRVYCTTSCFNPQLLQKHHIQILNGENPIQQKTFVNFLARAGNYNWPHFAVIFPPYQIWQVANPPQPSPELLGDANVKYVASTYPLNNPKFIIIGKFNQIYLYENESFKPRGYFENSTTQVNLIKYEPNSIVMTFPKSDTPRKLIFSENYFPGWIATENFFDYKVEPYNSVFRSVTILPGISQVEFKYQPEGFVVGKTITFAAVILLIIFFWYTRKKSA